MSDIAVTSGRLDVVDRGCARFQHLAITHLRDVLLDRIVEADTALLEQHHDGARRDELGVRERAEQVISAHRNAVLDVGEPCAVHIGDITAD